MHILLIQPSQYKDKESLLYGKLGAIEQPPMGLAMIAAVLLQAGFETDIMDLDAEKASLEDIIQTIDRKRTKLVGLSVVTPLFKNALRLCRELKARRPEVKICLGGYHPSMEPLACLEPDCIDYVVRGEGERVAVALAQAVAEGASNDRLRQVRGLCFKDNGRPVQNPDQGLIEDLDELPMPARQLLKNQNYSYPDTKYSPAFPLYTSRGCPGKCSFCLQHYVSGRKWRKRSASKIADEVEHLKSSYGASEIHIWDDMFTADKKHVFSIRDEFVRRKLKVALSFPAGIRVDTASPDVLSAMREMGGYSLAFGVESGVQEILDACHKGITLEEVRQAVRNAKALGFETWCFFMLGLPGDTRDTIRKTIDFAVSLDPDVVKFHIFKPFPGSEIFAQLKAQGLILDFDTEKYGIHSFPVHRTQELSPEDIFALQKQAYRKFFFRPKILFKQFQRLNSWTRFQNNINAGFRVLNMAFKKG